MLRIVQGDHWNTIAIVQIPAIVIVLIVERDLLDAVGLEAVDRMRLKSNASIVFMPL